MSKRLKIRQFGDPILRTLTSKLSKNEVLSEETQALITDMKFTIGSAEYGVGLAAPQIGKSLPISVVAIKPTPSRPKNPEISFVIINPIITVNYGKRVGLWEGCISFGGSKNFPYAKALRYQRIRLSYMDELGKQHEKDFGGLLAHVIQHEVDHLNGDLFVDKVKDTTTYMTVLEYKKRIKIE